MRKTIKRILIIYWGFLGDLLVATPLAAVLRRGLPRSYITYVVGDQGYEPKMPPYELGMKILEENPDIDERIRADRSILGTLRTLFMDKPYDLTINLYGNKTSELIVKASGARMKIWGKFRGVPHSFFYSENLSGEWTKSFRVEVSRQKYKYRGRQFLEIARFLGINIKDPATSKICLSAQERRFSREYLKKIRKKGNVVIGMHPGGQHPGRLWGATNYAALADGLIDTYNAKVIVFYAPGEKHFTNSVCKFARHKLITISEKDIRRYVSIISGCDLFISSDGGPLHMALSLGVPSIGIFRNRGNAIYWYNYKKRKGLFSVFVKSVKYSKRKTIKTGIFKRDIKEVNLALGKVKQALRLKHL